MREVYLSPEGKGFVNLCIYVIYFYILLSIYKKMFQSYHNTYLTINAF